MVRGENSGGSTKKLSYLDMNLNSTGTWANMDEHKKVDQKSQNSTFMGNWNDKILKALPSERRMG